MKPLKLIGIALLAIIMNSVLFSCGDNDDPTNSVNPAPTPINTTIKVDSVSVNTSSINMVEGDSHAIIVTVFPSNASDKKYTFSSSDTSIVTIDENGKITALKAGEAIITVTTVDGNKTTTCNINVSPIVISVESITLDKTELTLEEKRVGTLKVTILPENYTNGEVIWSSSDTSVVTVDENGHIIAIKAGEAIISVTTVDGNKTASCKVLVTKAPISVKEVKVVMDYRQYSTFIETGYDSKSQVEYIEYTDQKYKYRIPFGDSVGDELTINKYSYRDNIKNWVIDSASSFKLKNGLISEKDYWNNYFYDDNGYLKSLNSSSVFSGYYKVFWKDGNLVQIGEEKIVNTRPDIMYIEYSDFDWPDGFFMIDDWFVGTITFNHIDYWGGCMLKGYWGKHPKNLPKRIITKLDNVIEFDWTIEKGLPVYAKVLYDNNPYIEKGSLTFIWE